MRNILDANMGKTPRSDDIERCVFEALTRRSPGLNSAAMFLPEPQ